MRDRCRWGKSLPDLLGFISMILGGIQQEVSIASPILRLSDLSKKTENGS
jgi:hypothetical protein